MSPPSKRPLHTILTHPVLALLTRLMDPMILLLTFHRPAIDGDFAAAVPL